MVDVNNCPANVFCIGQLKAKDLKGNELSDITYRQQHEEEDESKYFIGKEIFSFDQILDENSYEDSNDVQPDQAEEDEEEEEEEEEE
jgi:hypothetical protein